MNVLRDFYKICRRSQTKKKLFLITINLCFAIGFKIFNYKIVSDLLNQE